MNDEEEKLMKTINDLTGNTGKREFEWVVRTIIQFKDNIDHSTSQLKNGKIEKGFEEKT